MTDKLNLLDLTKEFTLNLEKAGVTEIPTMEVRLAVDKSGSMYDEYKVGLVDSMINVFIATALKFDDNGELEMGFFDTQFHPYPVATEKHAKGYTKQHPVDAGGGTCYAPIIQSFETDRENAQQVRPEQPGWFKRAMNKLFGGAQAATTQVANVDGRMRAYIAVITDGAPGDTNQFLREMAQTSGNAFYQFITIGNGVTPDLLQRLAGTYPHVHFMHIRDPRKLVVSNFYEQLCNEKLVNWIKR